MLKVCSMSLEGVYLAKNSDFAKKKNAFGILVECTDYFEEIVVCSKAAFHSIPILAVFTKLSDTNSHSYNNSYY